MVLTVEKFQSPALEGGRACRFGDGQEELADVLAAARRSGEIDVLIADDIAVDLIVPNDDRVGQFDAAGGAVGAVRPPTVNQKLFKVVMTSPAPVFLLVNKAISWLTVST